MKVAIITDDINIRSGTGRYIHELINGLNEKGIMAEKITIKKSDICYGGVIDHIFRIPYNVIKKCSKYDIIHASNPITGLVFPLINKTPKIVTYHDLTSFLCDMSDSKFHVKMSSPLFLKIGKYSDRIIAISTQTKEEIINHIHISDDKIDIISLGVSEKFSPIKREDNEYYTIGYIGAFNKRKRIDFLIVMFYHLKKEYPGLKIKLHIWGGENSYDLKKLTERFKLERDIEFKGFVPEEKLVEIYNSFDIFVVPSEWEGFCIPILEAQKCGIPVIIRKDAHIPKEVSICCIKVTTEIDAANNIYELLTNTNLKKEIIRKGILYSGQFTWEKTIEQTIKAYEKIL